MTTEKEEQKIKRKAYYQIPEVKARQKAYLKEYYKNNKDKIKEQVEKWQTNHPGYRAKLYYIKYKYTRQKKRREKLYGLTSEDLQRIYLQQSNKCKLCHRELPLEKLNINHCHQTNKVRGLLCLHCNTGLGLFRDDIKLLSMAIKYLNGEI